MKLHSTTDRSGYRNAVRRAEMRQQECDALGGLVEAHRFGLQRQDALLVRELVQDLLQEAGVAGHRFHKTLCVEYVDFARLHRHRAHIAREPVKRRRFSERIARLEDRDQSLESAGIVGKNFHAARLEVVEVVRRFALVVDQRAFRERTPRSQMRDRFPNPRIRPSHEGRVCSTHEVLVIVRHLGSTPCR